ncbi:hypothetical protein D3C72_1538870 [compost metagenome]
MLERFARAFVSQRQGLANIHAACQFVAPARQLLGHPVQVARLAVRIGGDDAVADGAERHFGQFLALGDQQFAQHVLGDIPDDAQGAVGLAVRIREHLRLGRQPAFAAIGPDDAVLQGVAVALAHGFLHHLEYLALVIHMDEAEKGAKWLRQGLLFQAQQGSALG